MKNNKTPFLQLIVAICLLFPLYAQAQDPIGRVVRASGGVTAVDIAGAERGLARGSELFVDETVVTGSRGSTQLRLSDGALITLKESTQFVVNEYVYDGAGGNDDSVVMSVVEGAFRTVTGIIGEGQNDTYALNTPFATIGIRGTDFGVFVDAVTGRTRIAVFDGSIAVQPASGGGPTIVGLGGVADFVALEDDDAVVEVSEDTPDIEELINTIIEAVSPEDLRALPDPDRALQAEQFRDSTASAAAADGTTDQGGALVDAIGNAQNARTDEERQAALARLVETIIAVDPTFFDRTTVTSASPNR
tara:strand:+ start:2441 stop:3355 length:915 start_codon:yes stop_codon:yes gene_type:complete